MAKKFKAVFIMESGEYKEITYDEFETLETRNRFFVPEGEVLFLKSAKMTIVNTANMNVRKNTIPSVQEKTRTSLMICSQRMILMERIY